MGFFVILVQSNFTCHERVINLIAAQFYCRQITTPYFMLILKQASLRNYETATKENKETKVKSIPSSSFSLTDCQIYYYSTPEKGESPLSLLDAKGDKNINLYLNHTLYAFSVEYFASWDDLPDLH